MGHYKAKMSHFYSRCHKYTTINFDNLLRKKSLYLYGYLLTKSTMLSNFTVKQLNILSKITDKS